MQVNISISSEELSVARLCFSVLLLFYCTRHGGEESTEVDQNPSWINVALKEMRQAAVIWRVRRRIY